MSNISNYGNTTPSQPVSYARLDSNTKKVQEFAKYLHNMLPVLEEEFDSLERLSKTHNNDVFPIKMSALSEIYRAAGPLYEWYVEKAKVQAS